MNFEQRYTTLAFICLGSINVLECFYPIFEESKITKILNSEENSKRKVLNQMAKSKPRIHQTTSFCLDYSSTKCS